MTKDVLLCFTFKLLKIKIKSMQTELNKHIILIRLLYSYKYMTFNLINVHITYRLNLF